MTAFAPVDVDADLGLIVACSGLDVTAGTGMHAKVEIDNETPEDRTLSVTIDSSESNVIMIGYEWEATTDITFLEGSWFIRFEVTEDSAIAGGLVTITSAWVCHLDPGGDTVAGIASAGGLEVPVDLGLMEIEVQAGAQTTMPGGDILYFAIAMTNREPSPLSFEVKMSYICEGPAVWSDTQLVIGVF